MVTYTYTFRKHPRLIYIHFEINHTKLWLLDIMSHYIYQTHRRLVWYPSNHYGRGSTNFKFNSQIIPWSIEPCKNLHAINQSQPIYEPSGPTDNRSQDGSPEQATGRLYLCRFLETWCIKYGVILIWGETHASFLTNPMLRTWIRNIVWVFMCTMSS